MSMSIKNLRRSEQSSGAISKKRSITNGPESGTGQKTCTRKCSHAPLTIRMHFIF